MATAVADSYSADTGPAIYVGRLPRGLLIMRAMRAAGDLVMAANRT